MNNTWPSGHAHDQTPKFLKEFALKRLARVITPHVGSGKVFNDQISLGDLNRPDR